MTSEGRYLRQGLRRHFLLGADRRLSGKAGGAVLQPLGVLEPRHLVLQQANGVALGDDLVFDIGDVVSLGAGGGLERVDRQGEGEEDDHRRQVHHPKAAHPAKEDAGDGHAAAAQAGAAVRTAARSLAERARGLAASSASPGPFGPLNSSSKLGAAPFAAGGACRETPGVLPERSARKALTMRSSSEWKVTTASRPPAFSTRSAASKPASSSSSSAFTAIRSAWNTFVAGCVLAPRRPPRTFSTNSARSKVRVKGCSARRRLMAAAMRRPWVSSPNSLKMRASSAGAASLTRSAAVGPSAPMRMFNGPSRMKEKPRSASSSCMEETPRSKAPPSAAPSPSSAAIVENLSSSIRN